MKKKIKEEWKIEPSWFVSHKDNFFYIGDVIALQKTNGAILTICLPLCALNINFHDSKKERDGVFGFLQKGMIAYKDGVRKKQIEQQAIQRAQLEIQNRMAGKMCNN